MSSGYVIPVDPSQIANRYDSASDPRFDREDDSGLDDEIANVSDEAFAELIATNDYESKIVPLLDRIPQREADFIELYFVKHKRQLDIAHMFGVTQAAVSYRLERGIARLQFLLSVPQVTEAELRADLPEIFPTKLPCPWCRPQPKAPKPCQFCSDAHPDCPVCRGEGDTSEGPESTLPPPPPTPYREAGVCHACQGTEEMLIDVAILVGMLQTSCQSEVAKTLRLTQGRVRHRFFKAVEVLAKAAEANPKFEPYLALFSSISEGKRFNILREVELPQWQGRGGNVLK